MKNLLKCADALVKNSPTDVFQALMNWWAKDLGKENDALRVDKNWDNQCDLVGKTSATFCIDATCDMAAMCMMMAAAGVQRVEAMKNAIRVAVKKGIKNPVYSDDNTGDLVHIYKKPGEAKYFEQLLLKWCALEGNGAVQFKFKAKDDWHTFAVERAWDKDKDKEPVFFVYQAYQNTYRLADFLGVGDMQEQATHMALVWKYMDEEAQSAFDGLNDFTERALKRIELTSKTLGRGNPLDLAALKHYVLSPLVDMLAGGVSNKDYVLLTASGTTEETLRTDTMAVLMCNYVSPDNYPKNYADLRKLPKELSMYPECS